MVRGSWRGAVPDVFGTITRLCLSGLNFCRQLGISLGTGLLECPPFFTAQASRNGRFPSSATVSVPGSESANRVRVEVQDIPAVLSAGLVPFYMESVKPAI